MARGRIANLVSDRGFGFIQPEGEQGKDLFFHRTDVQGTSFEELGRGQEVEYDMGKDERRGTAKAINVRPV